MFHRGCYKFVAKLFTGMKNAVEIGCADAFGMLIVLQEVGYVVATDFDPMFVQDVSKRCDEGWPIDVRLHDILEKQASGAFGGVYSLDVLEHIYQGKENQQETRNSKGAGVHRSVFHYISPKAP